MVFEYGPLSETFLTVQVLWGQLILIGDDAILDMLSWAEHLWSFGDIVLVEYFPNILL